ncbi:MAG: phosphate ABC transporter substrate-binding protein [Syntrophomonadaceae bacterium]|nr:phosphate ABC transporter substrate-binding protein [Syntrophomonadaceae bacterium]
MSRFLGIKKAAFFAVGLLLLGLVAGCGSRPGNQALPPAAAKVTVAGSTSVQPFSELLAERFMAGHPDIRVEVQGGGSSAGIKAAQEGAAQIGASSRELKPEEKANLKEFIIAKDGIAVVVNPANPLANLGLDEVKKIFAGQVTNFQQVGGPDQEIAVITREAGSGTRGAFEELVMGKDTPITTRAIVQNSTGAVRTAVAADPRAIGYVSVASVDQGVKVVKVDGVEPVTANISSGTYKISRPFIYLTRGEPTGAARAFIDYVLSAEGQALLEKEGLVRVK